MKRFFVLIAVVVLLLAVLPYLIAWARTAPDERFVGYIFNPADNATYLAKMRLGWLGEWRLRLLSTPEAQTGAYLYFFYLGLGHTVQLLGLSLAIVYHAARLSGGIVLLMAVAWLCRRALPAGRAQRWGYIFAVLGGGVGWAFIWIDPLPVDLWVPEGYVFYSILVNAHFPWAQALLLSILASTALWRSGDIPARYALPAMALMLIALGVLQPFAVGQVGLIWGVWLILEWIVQRRIPWRTAVSLGVVGALGLLYPLYGVWAIGQDPVLTAWNAQNVTGSPPWWNWLIGYALVIPWAISGAVRAWRQGRSLDRVLLAWAIGSVVGMAAPISLQRRLSLGLSIPLGLLAGSGWAHWLDIRLASGGRWGNLLRAGMVVLVALTPVFLLMTGFGSPAQMPERFYVSVSEMDVAKTLLGEDPASVILASPERGEALPWMTGHQVVVGHPLETADFERRDAEARQFFDGSWDAGTQRDFLCREGVSYVWLGPMEHALSGADTLSLSGLRLVQENDDVRLYAVERDEVCLSSE